MTTRSKKVFRNVYRSRINFGGDCGSELNFCFTDCKWHIFDNHVERFQPQITSARPKCVDEVLANMISCGGWEPVDTEAAAKMINSRTESGEKFVYVHGWCSDWPLANDEDRKQKLKQLAQVLKSSCPNENNTLSCSLWEWLIDYTEENVTLAQVPGIYLDKCSIFRNPQCICFLELRNLEHILSYLKELLTADVCSSLFSKAVNRFWENSLVKERIDFERGTGNMLLDERLLYEGEHHFDEIGTIRTFHSRGIYEHVVPHGDKIISWVFDCPNIDENFVSQFAEGVHDVGVWLAALRMVRSSVRKLVGYCDKREKLITYDKMLREAEALCDNEDNRKIADRRSRYAWLLQEMVNQILRRDLDKGAGGLQIWRLFVEKN